jgi:hypothetical protein
LNKLGLREGEMMAPTEQKEPWVAQALVREGKTVIGKHFPTDKGK